jgi:hypothetical protein
MAPPQLNTNIVVKHKFRFRCTTGGAFVISSADVLGALGTTGVDGGTCVAVNDCFKVSSLSMWAPPPSQGTTATVAVEWNGQAQASSTEFSDTTVSTAQPAYLRSMPPSSSLAHFWQTPKLGSVSLLTLTAPTSTIVDLTVEYMSIDTGVQGLAFSTLGSSPGVISYLALDGYASNFLVPVALTSHA